MKVLVISDTHIPVTATKLPAVIENEAKTSDCCLHCGDFIVYPVLESLNTLTKTFGVCGNMDDDQIKENLPQKQVIKLEGITVGLIHGGGTQQHIIEYLNREFAKEYNEIDVFVFGHSHRPTNKVIDGKIYFNPGSCTDRTFAPCRSYGILEINGKDLKPRIINIE